MSNIPGNPASWATLIPMLSDATLPKGSDISVPLEALTDRTAYLKKIADAVGSIGYLNWPGGLVSPKGNDAGTFTRACMTYDATYGRFWIAGNGAADPSNPALIRVSDYGAGVSPPSLATTNGEYIGLAGANELVSDIACNIAGVVVVGTRTRYVYAAVGGLNPTMGKYDVYGAAITSPVNAAVVYCEPAGSWVWLCNNGTSPVVRRSSNPASAWSSGAAPGWAAATWRTFAMAARPNGSTPAAIIMAAGLTGSTVRTAITTDAGVSWTTKANITTAVGVYNNMPIDIVFDASAGPSGTWFMTIGDYLGSELWASVDDGATWTKRCSLALGLSRVAPVGDGSTLIAATYAGTLVASASTVIVSKDGGVTWYRLGISVAGLIGGDGSADAVATPSGFAVCWSQLPGQGSDGPGTRALFSLRTGALNLTSQVT